MGKHNDCQTILAQNQKAKKTHGKNNDKTKQRCSNYSGSEPTKQKKTWEKQKRKNMFKLVWLKGPMARLV